MEHTFKIGDTVKVRDLGFTYNTYGRMFEKFNFPNKTFNTCAIDDTGTIVGLAYHEDTGDPLLAIKNHRQDNNDKYCPELYFVIGSDGVEAWKPEVAEGPYSLTKQQLIDFTRQIQERCTKAAIEAVKSASFDFDDMIELELDWNKTISIEFDEHALYKEMESVIDDAFETDDDSVLDEALNVIEHLNKDN
jgi:hypothetical protein